jgi:hypothetical protein
MNQHPYLRAYMAGIAVPTLLLLVGMTAFLIARHTVGMPLPIERAVVFPLTVVPNLWGLWNILWVGAMSRRLSLGAWGALMPLLLVPAGWAVTQLVGFELPRVAPLLVLPVGVVVYYLVWKHIVSRLNSIIGIA